MHRHSMPIENARAMGLIPHPFKAPSEGCITLRLDQPPPKPATFFSAPVEITYGEDGEPLYALPEEKLTEKEMEARCWEICAYIVHSFAVLDEAIHAPTPSFHSFHSVSFYNKDIEDECHWVIHIGDGIYLQSPGVYRASIEKLKFYTDKKPERYLFGGKTYEMIHKTWVVESSKELTSVVVNP